MEFRATGAEVFLKQLYISPARQGRGTGTQVMKLLLEEQRGSAKSMALFVFKNNSALRFYERNGFNVVREAHTTLVMRRAMAEAA